MKLLGLVAVAGGAALAVLAAPAGATNECRGFQVCAPVAGPWVVVPTANAFPSPDAKWLLSCPKRYIVGGLDAELTDRSIDVTFEALLGSPVNPGISTSTTALFTGLSVSGPVRAASFRPHIGCIPATGGGGGIPTAVHVVPPGHPTTRHVWNLRLHPGLQNATKTCAAGERLVDASVARGFYGKTPPGTRLIGSVHVGYGTGGGRVQVVVRSGRPIANVRAVVQILLICAGGT